jgi:hypothetical protein
MVEKNCGDSLASCIFAVVQLVVGSPRCGFCDYVLYIGLTGQSAKLALHVVVADTTFACFTSTSTSLLWWILVNRSITSEIQLGNPHPISILVATLLCYGS